MNQFSLLDPPIARKRDPDTSRTAAVDYDESGKRSKDCRLLLDAVRRFPGHTCGEYSKILWDEGLDWYKAARMTSRRMSDLFRRGDVEVVGTKTCDVTGSPAQMYRGRV